MPKKKKSILERALSTFGAGSAEGMTDAQKRKRQREAEERLRKRQGRISKDVGGTRK